jgi:hypothetical protein
MGLLGTLTIVWAVVLVLALAASLVAIRVRLGRIERALAEVREALLRVRGRTALMPGHFRALDAALASEPVRPGTRRD